MFDDEFEDRMESRADLLGNRVDDTEQDVLETVRTRGYWTLSEGIEKEEEY